MQNSVINEQQIQQSTIDETIKKLMNNLVTIKDTDGEFLLDFDDIIVDDKSWNVWNWPQGIGLYGIYKYWEITKNEKAWQIIIDWFEQQFALGSPSKNVNTMAPLLTMAYLYEQSNDCRFLPYLENWAEWVMNDMPRTEEEGLEHFTYGPENIEQLWDDTLMMTVLPLAKIGLLLNRPQYLEEAKRQFILHTKYLCDKKTGLWFHGWTFLENHNYAEALWARGNCWITIAIPEIIDLLDLKPGDAFREFLIETLKKQVSTLKKLQSPSGLWHTLLDDETSYCEASATAGFAYGLLKAARKNYIDKEYKAVAEKAISGLLNEINEVGAVQKVSVGTGLGEDLTFYQNIRTTEMPYGQSLTILALSEYLYEYI
ncbi:beta-galactosidase BglB [Melissococcus plutonius]|uniref:Rhamnogalacturonides degradation protein RhiN n=1 Tax=Melissococcus plutonius TaxID=33970 RepID=A0A2Z5Y121_9ENTE|nr:rhamnogalacturonides degradation protein RhiN [Melissococcus plutonius DAT561]BBC60496.1 rhamnogalacturonides degradation protein RhiN [Melissococcus plutonius]